MSKLFVVGRHATGLPLSDGPRSVHHTSGMAATRRCSRCVLRHTGPGHLDVPPRGWGPCLFGLMLARTSEADSRTPRRVFRPQRESFEGPRAHSSQRSFNLRRAPTFPPSAGPITTAATTSGGRAGGRPAPCLFPVEATSRLAPLPPPPPRLRGPPLPTTGRVHTGDAPPTTKNGRVPYDQFSIFSFPFCSGLEGLSTCPHRGRDFLESAPKQPGCGRWTARLWPVDSQAVAGGQPG